MRGREDTRPQQFGDGRARGPEDLCGGARLVPASFQCSRSPRGRRRRGRRRLEKKARRKGENHGRLGELWGGFRVANRSLRIIYNSTLWSSGLTQTGAFSVLYRTSFPLLPRGGKTFLRFVEISRKKGCPRRTRRRTRRRRGAARAPGPRDERARGGCLDGDHEDDRGAAAKSAARGGEVERSASRPGEQDIVHSDSPVRRRRWRRKMRTTRR